MKNNFKHTIKDVGVTPKYLKLEELDGKSCRFPVNTPDAGQEYLFCGHNKGKNQSYCDAHKKLCNPENREKSPRAKFSKFLLT